MKSSQGRCSKCLLSDSFPRIEFDEHGVCNFCRDTLLLTSEDAAVEKARLQIDEYISRIKGQAEYDAVMCYSGGKDSTYSLMLAVKKYGLRVLSFTLDNGYISPTAFKNINHVVEYLGVDQITFKPSIKEMNAIIKASALNAIYNAKTLTRISSVCNSCISIVNNTALKIALEKKIPLILAGFTLGQIPVNGIIYQNNYEFLKESRELPLSKLREKAGDGIDPYFSIPGSLLGSGTVYPSTLNLLCVETLTEHEVIQAVSEIGWVAPKDVDGCSSNCRLNSFNNMVHVKTFGYNPYELELSRLIHKGLLSREEGLKKIADQPVEEQREVMNVLGITEQDLSQLNTLYKKR